MQASNRDRVERGGEGKTNLGGKSTDTARPSRSLWKTESERKTVNKGENK